MHENFLKSCSKDGIVIKHHRTVVFLFILVSSSFIGFIFKYPLLNVESKEALTIAIFAGLVQFIAYKVLFLPSFLKIWEESTRVKLENDLEDFVNKCPSQSINSKLAGHLKNDLYKRLSIDNQNHQFGSNENNRWAATEIYELFWDTFIKLPRTSKPLKCYAINSSSLDVWTGVDGKIFLNLQQAFCNNEDITRVEGELHRILCYDKKDITKDTDIGKRIKTVAAKMIKAGASVYFYDISSDKYTEHQYQIWDFLVTEGEIAESVIWTTACTGGGKVPGSPTKATCGGNLYYSCSEDQKIDLKKRWDEIYKYVERFELTKDGVSAELKPNTDILLITK